MNFEKGDLSSEGILTLVPLRTKGDKLLSWVVYCFGWEIQVFCSEELFGTFRSKYLLSMLLRKGFGTILNRRGGCAGAGHKRSRFYQAANLATATINIARCTIAECKHAQTLIKLGRCKPYYSHVVYSNGLRPLEQPRRTAQELGQCFWNTFLWQPRELYLLAPPGLQL